MDKLRFGVIGVGWQGGGHLSILAADPRAELVAICDLNADLLKQRQAEHNVRHTFTDYRELCACDEADADPTVVPDHLQVDPA